MYKIQIFRNDRYKIAEFTFAKIIPTYNPQGEWVTVSTSGGQVITLSGVASLMYDDNIENLTIISEYGEWKHSLSRNYAAGKKSLVVFNEEGFPIRQFCGYKIQLIERSNGLDHFVIDERDIWLYHLNFMILTRENE